MFLSFKLEDVEKRYTTTEKEALAVIRCLAEIRRLVMRSPFPIKIYTDHMALESILRIGDAHGKITRWMDRLSEYDYQIYHRPCRTNIMRIADGLSRMPGIYFKYAVTEDSERLFTAATFGMQSRGETATGEMIAGPGPSREVTEMNHLESTGE